MEINITNVHLIAEAVKALNQERVRKDWYMLVPKDVLRKNLRRYFGLSTHEINKFFNSIDEHANTKKKNHKIQP